MSLGLGAGNAELTFDENATFEDTSLQATLNRRTRTAWAGASSPGDTAHQRGRDARRRTPSDFPFSPERNANTVSILPGVEFQPRALVSGTAAVGVRAFRPENAATGLPEYTGMIANANLVYTLKGSTRFRFSANRDLAVLCSPRPSPTTRSTDTARDRASPRREIRCHGQRRLADLYLSKLRRTRSGP